MESFQPNTYLRVALTTIREQPALLVLKAMVDLVLGATQVLAMALVFMILTLAFVQSVRLHGDAFLAPWMSFVTNPRFVVAVAGIGFGLWVLGFALQSGVSAVILDYLAERFSAQDAGVCTLQAGARLGRSWGRAVVHRLYMLLTEVFVLALFGSTFMATLWVTRTLGRWSDSQLLVPALIWAAVLALVSVFAILFRLAAELVAAAWFIEGRPLGSAMLDAMQMTLQHPIRLYRLFITAIAVLLVPLFLYWCAVMVQNITMNSSLAVVGSLARLAGEVVLLVGLAAFVVVFQAMFFAFYAVATGRIEQLETVSEFLVTRNMKPRSLQERLPKSSKNVADLDAILSWTETVRDYEPPEVPPDPVPAAPVQAFDLNALLRPDASSSEEE